MKHTKEVTVELAPIETFTPKTGRSAGVIMMEDEIIQLNNSSIRTLIVSLTT